MNQENSTHAIEILKDVSRRHSDATFLVDDELGIKLTCEELEAAACVVGNYLLATGLNTGDRIVVVSQGSSDLVKIYFACLYFGLVVVPVNPTLLDEEIDFIVVDSGAVCVIASKDQSERVVGLDSKPEVFIIGVETDAALHKMGIGRNLLNPRSETQNLQVEKLSGVHDSNEMVIIYTSGTTSRPKGVIHSFSNIVGNAIVFGKLHGLNERNRFLNCLPLTYLGGYYNLLILPYVNGSSVVLTRPISASSALRFWETIISNAVNTLWFVPTIMSMLMELDRGSDGAKYCKGEVKLAFVGTDVLRSELKNKFEEKYGIELFENYGLSETLFISSNVTSSEFPKEGVGRLVPGVQIKIVDRNMTRVSKGNEGEILVKTPFRMKGYLKQRMPLESGWFVTGDLGFFTADGNLIITGRKKDLIIRGGVNISPRRVEEIANSHRAVVECAVFGSPDPIAGEKITAVVRTEPDYRFSESSEKLRLEINQKLSVPQRIEQIVQLQQFPRTASGKIQKEKIKAWLRNSSVTSTDPGGKSHPIVQEPVAPSYFRPSAVSSGIAEAISITYNNIVYEKKRDGHDIITLSLGEAFFDLPLRNFDGLPFPDIYHYSHSRGIPELRRKLADYFLDRYEVSFDPEKEIIITAGSKIAIYMTLLAILNPGDEVIIFEPAWVSYTEQVKMCHGLPVQVPYWVEYPDYEKYITNRTKALILNNPQNPSGKIYSLEELTFICSLAEKYNLYIVSDEVYSEFVTDDSEFISIGNLDAEKNRLVICNSISKNYGISGWRLGYAITNSELTNQLLKLNQHMMTCPSTILQYYVAEYFDDIIKETAPQILSVVRKRNEILQYLEQLGLVETPGSATFYIFVSIKESRLKSDAFCRKLLNEKNVAVVPGIGYGDSCDDYIRVSVGTESQERTKNGLRRISQLIEDTRLE